MAASTSTLSSSNIKGNKAAAKKAATGKTDDGTQFLVPTTYDLVHNLAGLKFNYFEMFALVLCWGQLFLFLFGCPRWILVLLFCFWRALYNGGLGVALSKQSTQRWVTKKLTPFFEKGTKSREFLKRQLVMKMEGDYDFESVPTDYNVWLVFRCLVDTVLWNDFSMYFVVAFAYWEHPSPFTLVDAIFHVLGFSLIVLCYFIKRDAIRVVGDFAWYWGDFFFLIDSSLTFDGVFQMAPHPMYSIGYLGYYGVAIMSRSYAVLYISLAAHICQFLFLSFAENPHIERTYNSMVDESEQFRMFKHHRGPQPFFHRDLIIFKNLDIFRSFDFATALVVLQTLLVFFVGAPTWLLVLQCLWWRVFHSFGLGWVLHMQSLNRWFTKHFIKYGGTRQAAFQSWKQIYNLSLIMTHLSFYLVAIRFYTLPDTFMGGVALLKHTVGVLLLALHAWSSKEMFEVIKEFGWFYGDFFLEPVFSSPEYTGIYRFVNNPEKVLGQAAFYGVALICDSWVMFGLALFSHCSMALFLHYVESPHMRRLYGDEVRSVSGFKQAVKTKLTPLHSKIKPFKLLNEIDRWVDRVKIDAKLRIKQNLELRNSPRNLKHRVNVAVKTADLVISGARPSPAVCAKYTLSLESESFVIGQPIKITWTAPEGHSLKDWVGVYPVGQNMSASVTVNTSKGCWKYLNAESSQSSGTTELSGIALPWKAGLYEARLHYDNNHGVLAISEPFEIVHGDDFPRQDCDEEPINQEQITEMLIQFFRITLERPEISGDTEFATASWGPYMTRAVNEFLESTFAVTSSADVLSQFNTPNLLAYWVKEACDALLSSFSYLDGNQEAMESPTKKSKDE